MEALHMPQACKVSCSDGLGMVGQEQTEISLVVGSDTPRLRDRTMAPSRALDRDRGGTPLGIPTFVRSVQFQKQPKKPSPL